MGCPVPKVRKTGAGAQLLSDPDRAVALARAAAEGAAAGAEERGAAGGAAMGIPVTVKLRSGLRPGESSGYDVAHRLVDEAGVAAIGFHPRSAAVHHKGDPDYELAARLVATLPAPVILTGGLDDAESVREAFEATGAAAVMLARGALGNPWLFEQLLERRDGEPQPQEVRAELAWTIDRAVEHLGEQRASRYLRKFYPWYLPRLGLDPSDARALQEALQSADSVAEARTLLELEGAPTTLAGRV
jgi:tRNA-dihydrouridine synthase B